MPGRACSRQRIEPRLLGRVRPHSPERGSPRFNSTFREFVLVPDGRKEAPSSLRSFGSTTKEPLIGLALNFIQ